MREIAGGSCTISSAHAVAEALTAIGAEPIHFRSKAVRLVQGNSTSFGSRRAQACAACGALKQVRPYTAAEDAPWLFTTRRAE